MSTEADDLVKLAHALTHVKLAVDFIVRGAKARPDLMCGYWDDACTHAEIAQKDIEAFASRIASQKAAEVDALRKALTTIARWNLPATGKFWDAEGNRPTSYETEYGSNGARDYMRQVALNALAAASPAKPGGKV